jgi:putative transposase
MEDIYLIASISKQGHLQALQHQQMISNKEITYVGLMHTMREMHPGMGLRTMYEQCKPEDIGRDAFIALGLREGFRLQAYQSPIKTTRADKNSKFQNLLVDFKVTDVNQLWVSDITYYELGDKHYYIVLIMDVYSRRIVGHSVADNMRAENNISALKMALTLRGISNYQGTLIHHSDRGSQYTSNDYTALLGSRGIKISMCTNVLENAHSERANGTIKNDYLRRWGITIQEELYKSTPRAIDNYNNRNHKSLPKMTPIQFETYVKELDWENRPIIPIFTMTQTVLNNNQLCLFND